MTQELIFAMLIGVILLFIILLVLLFAMASKPDKKVNEARAKVDLQKIKRQIEKFDDE